MKVEGSKEPNLEVWVEPIIGKISEETEMQEI